MTAPLAPRRPVPPPAPILTGRYVTLSRLSPVELAAVLDALLAMEDDGLPVSVSVTVPERAADSVRAMRRDTGEHELIGGVA